MKRKAQKSCMVFVLFAWCTESTIALSMVDSVYFFFRGQRVDLGTRFFDFLTIMMVLQAMHALFLGNLESWKGVGQTCRGFTGY